MIFAAILAFLADFFHQLPHFGPRFLISWAVVLATLLFLGSRLKGHLRPTILHIDNHVRTWALSLRFRERGNLESDRHGRTWFMRFWTNFASAPSLSVLSVALAVWAHYSRQPNPALFYFPGLCYLGSVSHSYVSKRVIKRVRPPRTHGSFGFTMKDGSFPSGHSLTSFCFWAAVAITAGIAGWSSGAVIAVVLIALITVGLTGLSRIYMGVHFPTDVLGGFSMGAIWTLVSFFVLLPALRSAM